MNKIVIYGLLFFVIVFGAKTLTSLQYEVDLKEYNLAPKKDIHAYEQFVHDLDSTAHESSIIIVENNNRWIAIEEFEILDKISTYWSNRSEIDESYSILDLKYPKKRLIRSAVTPFLNLNKKDRFEQRMQNAASYSDIFEKFISADSRYTLIFLETKSMLTSASKDLFEEQFQAYDQIKTHYIQNESIENELEKRLNKDTFVLGLVSIILILGGFYFFTHSLKGIFLITLMVVFNIAATFLLIDLLDISFTMHMVTIPCIITILSFTDIMHILHYQNVYKHKSDHDRQLQKRIANKLKLPLVLTSLTNIIGFIIFFVISDNQYLMDYSIAATIGVLTAYASSRFIVIRLMQKESNYIQRDTFASITNTHKYIARLILGFRRRFVILLLSVSLVIASYVLVNFEIDNSDTAFIISENGTDILQKSFFGSHQAEVLITIKNDSIWNEQYISQIDTIEHEISRIFDPLYINSPNNLVKRYYRYSHNGRPDAFRLPKNMGRIFVRDLVKTKQALGGQGIVNEDHTKARIVFGYNNSSLSKTRSQYLKLRKTLEQFDSEIIHYSLSGLQVLSNESTYGFGLKLIIGFIGSIVFGCLFIMIFLRSLSKGLLFVFVNLFPIFLAIGVLIFFKIAITPLTIFLLSILLGVCLDDSIYLIMQKEKDPKFNHILPIFITSVVLSVGFISFSTSEFQWIQPFGWIFPIGILTAYVLDVSILKIWSMDKE